MFEHAKDRALERYNQKLSNHDLVQIVNLIKSQQHIPLSCTTDNPNKKFCYVLYHKIPYKVLYHHKAKGAKCKTSIITIYPLDVDEYNKCLEDKKLRRIDNAINLLKSEGYIVYKRKNK